MTQRGKNLRLVIYETEPCGEYVLATGYSFSEHKEYILRCSNSNGIYAGTTVSFTISEEDGDGRIIPVSDSIKTENEAEELVVCEEGQIRLKAHIIFSAREPEGSPCAWSPEFAWVLVPESYHINRDVVFTTYVKRDRSQLAVQYNVLFTVVDIPKPTEGSDKKSSYLQTMHEEEDERDRRRKAMEPPGPVFGQTGFGNSNGGNRSGNGSTRNNSNYYNGNTERRPQPAIDYNKKTTNPYYASSTRHGRNEEEEKHFKQWAASETFFLVTKIGSGGGSRDPRTKGEAWGSNCRSITMDHYNLDQSEERVKVGDWCSGVVKYNRKATSHNNGFYVEKIHQREPKILQTYPGDKGELELAIELDFSEDGVWPKRDRRLTGYVCVYNPQIREVIVPEKVFAQYRGEKVHACLKYTPLQPEFLSNWIWYKFVNILGKHDRIAPTIEEDVAGDAHASAGSEDGGRPPDMDDDFDDDDDDYAPPHHPQFTNQPPPARGGFNNAPPLIRPEPVRGSNGFSDMSRQPERDDWRDSSSSAHYQHRPETSDSAKGSRFSAPSRDSARNRRHDEREAPRSSSLFDLDTYAPVLDSVQGLVTEFSRNSAIAFSNDTEACIITDHRDAGVRIGDWITFSANKLRSKQAGCWYVAKPGSVIKKAEPVNPVRVSADNGTVLMDTVLDFLYDPVEPYPSTCVCSLDVGWCYARPKIQCEQDNGIEEIAKLKERRKARPHPSNEKDNWRAWVQYVYSSERQDYHWEVIYLRGVVGEVQIWDTDMNSTNLRGVTLDDDDDVALEKEKAKAREEMERMREEDSRGEMSDRSARNAQQQQQYGRTTQHQDGADFRAPSSQPGHGHRGSFVGDRDDQSSFHQGAAPSYSYTSNRPPSEASTALPDFTKTGVSYARAPGCDTAMSQQSLIDDMDLQLMWAIDKVRDSIRDTNRALFDRMEALVTGVRSKSVSVRSTPMPPPGSVGPQPNYQESSRQYPQEHQRPLSSNSSGYGGVHAEGDFSQHAPPASRQPLKFYANKPASSLSAFGNDLHGNITNETFTTSGYGGSGGGYYHAQGGRGGRGFDERFCSDERNQQYQQQGARGGGGGSRMAGGWTDDYQNGDQQQQQQQGWGHSSRSTRY